MEKINYELRYKCGIYILINKINGKRYIGSSKNLYDRLHCHCCLLKRNKSHNKHLQNAWNKYGQENFSYSILEFCEPNIRFEREEYYIHTLKPEYNFSCNVIANYGRKLTDEEKLKISNTLKKRYKNKEIITYRHPYAWIKCFVYNLCDYTFYKRYDCIADMRRELKTKCNKEVFDSIIHDKYVALPFKINNKLDLINYINKMYFKARGINKYLVVDFGNGKIKYYKYISEIIKEYNLSSKKVHKHLLKNLQNVYFDNTNFKIYYTTKYIKILDTALYFEKSNN